MGALVRTRPGPAALHPTPRMTNPESAGSSSHHRPAGPAAACPVARCGGTRHPPVHPAGTGPALAPSRQLLLTETSQTPRRSPPNSRIGGFRLSRPQVSGARYTGGRETPMTSVTWADGNLWACGAVVARVAYNDNPGPRLPQAVTSRNSHSCRSEPSIVCPASSSEWHRLARLDRIPDEFPNENRTIQRSALWTFARSKLRSSAGQVTSHAPVDKSECLKSWTPIRSG
jgi:hypothetical protein